MTPDLVGSGALSRMLQRPRSPQACSGPSSRRKRVLAMSNLRDFAGRPCLQLGQGGDVFGVVNRYIRQAQVSPLPVETISLAQLAGISIQLNNRTAGQAMLL